MCPVSTIQQIPWYFTGYGKAQQGKEIPASCMNKPFRNQEGKHRKRDAPYTGIVSYNTTLSKILCKWKQDSAVSLFLYLDSGYRAPSDKEQWSITVEVMAMTFRVLLLRSNAGVNSDS